MAVFRSKCEALLKIIPDLQCHVCRAVPGPRNNQKHRYFCSNISESHALCHRHADLCPCGFPVGGEPSPLVANLLQNFPWMCQNYTNGCREILEAVEDLEHHQGECNFRKVYCPCLSCTTDFGLVLFRDVVNHMARIHAINGLPIDAEIMREGATKFIIKSSLKRIFTWGKYFAERRGFCLGHF